MSNSHWVVESNRAKKGHLAQPLLMGPLERGDSRDRPKLLSVGKPGPAYYLAPLGYLRHSTDGSWEHQGAEGTEIETITGSSD